MKKSKPKTRKQIDAEIAKLKEYRPKVRRYDFFGEDNWAKIDMEIRVLEGGMDEDAVHDFLDREMEIRVLEGGMDEDAVYDFLDRELDAEAIAANQRAELDSIAYDAIQWRDGEDVEESPAEGWEGLIK